MGEKTALHHVYAMFTRLRCEGIAPSEFMNAMQTPLAVYQSKDLACKTAQRIFRGRGAAYARLVRTSRQKDARNEKGAQRTHSVPDSLCDFRLGLSGAMQRQRHLQVHVRDFFT